MSRKEEKITSKKLHEAIAKSNSSLEDLFEESKKYGPAYIVSDRIKAEINRLSILQNQIRLEFQRRRMNRLSWYIFVVLALVILSFFIKPKLLFELTLNNTLLLVILGVIGTIIHLIWTKPDREAKRKQDLAQAEYVSAQTKLVQAELEAENNNKE